MSVDRSLLRYHAKIQLDLLDHNLDQLDALDQHNANDQLEVLD